MSSYLTISHGAGAAPFVLPSNSTAGQCLISRGGHIALSFPPLYGGGLLVALAQVAVVYYAVAAVLHCVVPRLLRPPSIQPAPRRAGQAWREARNSIGPIVVKAVVLTAVERLHAAGYGKMYTGLPSTITEVLYMLATAVSLDYLHDAWFYWTHRLLHWQPLYRSVHNIHHDFHVAEAALVFANEITVVFLFPIHAGLHRVYHLATTAIHIGGHAGYEIAPLIPSVEQLLWTLGHLAVGKRPGPASDLNIVADHDMHHRFPRTHFSLYFRHWDVWCGTGARTKARAD